MKLILVHDFATGAEIYIIEEKIVSFTKPHDRSGTYISTDAHGHHVREDIKTLLKKPKRSKKV